MEGEIRWLSLWSGSRLEEEVVVIRKWGQKWSSLGV